MFSLSPHLTLSFGPLTLPTWGLFFVLGYLTATSLALRQAKKEGIERKKIIDLAFWLILTGLVGARLFYVLEHLSYFLGSPLDILKIWQGGLTSYGGFLTGGLAAGFYLKKNKLPFYLIADIVTLSLPLGIFFTRLGCFLINDHPGRLTSLPWAIDFGQGFRHPVSLYLALNALVMFLVMQCLRRRDFSLHLHRHSKEWTPEGKEHSKEWTPEGKEHSKEWTPEGKEHSKVCTPEASSTKLKPCPTFIFLLWYPISRFLLDFFRARDLQESDPVFLGLTIAQWISLGLLLGLACLSQVNLSKPGKEDGD